MPVSKFSLMMIFSSAIGSFLSLAASHAQPTTEHPNFAQHLTINVIPLWEQGFEGQGQALIIYESGMGTRNPSTNDPNGNFPPGEIDFRFEGRVIEEVCAPNIICTQDNSHANTSTLIAAGRARESDAPPGKTALDSDQQGVARGADIIAVSNIVFLADLNDLIDDNGFFRGEHKVSAISMSFSYQPTQSPCGELEAVNALRAKDIVLVAGAGNGGLGGGTNDPDILPRLACLEGVISVGSTTPDDQFLSSISNYSTELDFVAPGLQSGATSVATPHVSGAIAVLKSAHPTCSGDQIVSALKATGKMITHRVGSTTPLPVPKPRIDVGAAHIFLQENLCQPAAITTLDNNGTITVIPVPVITTFDDSGKVSIIPVTDQPGN